MFCSGIKHEGFWNGLRMTGRTYKFKLQALMILALVQKSVSEHGLQDYRGNYGECVCPFPKLVQEQQVLKRSTLGISQYVKKLSDTRIPAFLFPCKSFPKVKDFFDQG